MNHSPFRRFLRFCAGMVLAGVLPAAGQDDIPGLPDVSFVPKVQFSRPPGIAVSQPDGKVLIGAISRMNDRDVRLARLHPNGDLEDNATFNPEPALKGAFVECLALLPDGKILAGGESLLVRLNPDGSLDNTFGPPFLPPQVPAFTVMRLAIQRDGRILAAGHFDFAGGPRYHLLRFSAGGVLEGPETFSVQLVTSRNYNDPVEAMAVQEDGRILIAGPFESVSGERRRGIARLHSDGSLDRDFLTIEAYDKVDNILMQPDGRILAMGDFRTDDYRHFVRLLGNGTPESALSFDTGNSDLAGRASLMALQANGHILAGGGNAMPQFFYPHTGRFGPDGRIEPLGSFHLGFGLFGEGRLQLPRIISLFLEGDGRVLITGDFTVVDTEPRPGLARLINNPGEQSFEVYASTLLWKRSGSLPEVGMVTFELSTDGGQQWSRLADGTPMAGGWMAAGLTLPAMGHLRARGRTGGPFSAVSGVAEYIAPFSVATVPAGPPVLHVEQPAGAAVTTDGRAEFGHTFTGSSGSLRFTVRNTGGTDLRDVTASISGPDAGFFTLAEPPAAVVPPASAATFSVQFRPQSIGAKTATLHIRSNDAENDGFNITLTGDGLTPNAPDISVEWGGGTGFSSGDTLDFGELDIWAQGGPGMDIVNRGVADLTGLTVTITGPGADCYTFIEPLPEKLEPGMSGILGIWVRPRETGMQPALLRIVSNDPDESPFYLRLTSAGVMRTFPGLEGGRDALFQISRLNGRALCAATQADGKTVIGGEFTAVNGASRRYIARLQEDGSLDPAFVFQASGPVRCLVTGMDGSMLAVTDTALHRLKPDGSADGAFAPAADGPFRSVGVLPDGKILVLHHPDGISAAPKLLRLLPSGAADPDSPQVEAPVLLTVKGDGGYFLGTTSGSSVHTAQLTIVELDPAGNVLDTGVVTGPAATLKVNNIALTDQNKAVYGGDISGPEWSVMKAGSVTGQADGGVYHELVLKSSPFPFPFEVWSGDTILGLQANGALLVTDGNNVMRANNVAPATHSLTVKAEDRVEWLRGGASPAAMAAVFDLSTDGGVNWTALGAGAPVTGGWELTGLSLPERGLIRARARTTANVNRMNSSGLVEARAEYSLRGEPEIMVENAGGVLLASGGAVDFGTWPPGTTVPVLLFIKNGGTEALTDVEVAPGVDGQPGDFEFDPIGRISIAPGESVFLRGRFKPTAAGQRTATLHIASNDPDESPFALALRGRQASPEEMWNRRHFGSYEHPDADGTADPDRDGLSNLMERATGGDPLVAGGNPLSVMKNGGTLELRWPRAVASNPDLRVIPEWCDDPAGPWMPVDEAAVEVLDDDGFAERVMAVIPAGERGMRFVRLWAVR